MVYVTNRQGKALMPTDRHGKVKIVGKLSAVHNHIFGYRSQGKVDIIKLNNK